MHQPQVQAKISQVGDTTIMTSNKGWSFNLNGPPPSACHRCGGNHWEICCVARTGKYLSPESHE